MFVYRNSIVKGFKYLQVWEKVSLGKYEYRGRIGTPEQAYNMLVKLNNLEKLTNDLQEQLTNSQAQNNKLLTKIKDLTK